MKNKSSRTKSKLNVLVTLLVMLAALWFFSSRSNGGEAPAVVKPETPRVTAKTVPGSTPSAVVPSSASPGAGSSSGEQSSAAANIPQVPAAFPADRAVITQPSGPTELPPDIQEQLNASPPELPEDLKRQLAAPPPELPDDLKAQLKAPPPEIPEDIKRAMQIPPRIVTIDEVNNPKLLQEHQKAAPK